MRSFSVVDKDTSSFSSPRLELESPGALQGKIEELARAQQQETSRMRELVNRVHSLANDLQRGQSEVSILREHVDSGQQRMSNLGVQLDTQQQEVNTWREHLDSMSLELSTLRQERDTMQQELHTLRVQIDRQQAHVSREQQPGQRTKPAGQGKVSRERVIVLDRRRTAKKQQPMDSAQDELVRRIEELLNKEPALSGRAIAGRVGCSPMTAAKWKAFIGQQQRTSTSAN